MRSMHYTNLSIDEEDDSFAAYASFDIASQSSNDDSDDDCSGATPTAAHPVRFSPVIEYVTSVYSPPPPAARATHPTLRETTLGFKGGVRNNESYGLLSNAQRKAVAFSLLDDDDDDDFIEKGNEDGGCENTKGACEFVFSPLVHFLQFYMC